jgi:endonuclease/exonuclease/phosphatase family metal-dependent hydrolase
MSQALRIATFNLENLEQVPGRAAPLDERLSVLRPQLLRLEADVLCLQEVNAQRPSASRPRALFALDRLLEETPYAGYRRFAGGGVGDAGGLSDIHNLVILSRLPFRSARALRHALVAPLSYRPTTAQPPAEAAEPVEWDRPILAVELELPGGRGLHLVNLHLRATLAAPIAGQKESTFAWKSVEGWAEGFFLATLKRAGQALEARLLVDRIFDDEPEALVAVVGDFNAEESEAPLRILRADTEDTGNGLLARRSLIPLERTLPDSQRFSVLHHGRRVMLDHLLVSRALLGCFRDLEVHNETVGDELVAAAGIAHGTESYHAPLVAEFALPD